MPVKLLQSFCRWC